METTSFVLGMLTITGLVGLITLVVGMVKIAKYNRKVNSILEQIEAMRIELHKITDEVYRDINMVEGTLQNAIRDAIAEEHRDIVSVHSEIERTKSYIDSRIDKIVATGTLKSSKQVLKG